MKFTVTSDQVAGRDRGDTVDGKDFPAGTNLEALVEAGHLAPKSSSSAKKEG